MVIFYERPPCADENTGIQTVSNAVEAQLRPLHRIVHIPGKDIGFFAILFTGSENSFNRFYKFRIVEL